MQQDLQHADRTNKPLLNRSIVIIGGSSGIGLATAAQARNAGGDIILVARDADRLRHAAAWIGGARTIVGDIAAPRPGLFEEIATIDDLVLTAGSVKLQKLEDQSGGDLHRVLQERVVGPLLAVKAALPRLRPGGTVTFVSGQFASRPAAIGAILAASLSAIETIVRALALELAPVRVNAVSPGWVDTPLLDQILGESKKDILDHTAATLPIRHIGRPEDIAAAILFLMTNRFVTGEIVHVDGGGRLV